ncbi:MAG: helix-turn-helix transcriptional regulator [Sulfurisoma sp.]|nr:helix-turn-helix transcriptional regulator [Sulfurisoma sp.]
MGTIDLYTAEEICRTLGQRCRALRLARDLSQSELAARVGASLSSIRRLEASGSGPLELLVRVAQSLQVVSQFEPLLMQPVLTIADAERETAARSRRRAARRNKVRAATPPSSP